MDDLRTLTAVLARLHEAPRIANHPYWRYDYPGPGWRAVRASLRRADPEQDRRGLEKLEEKTLAGWLCQLAGGAFGTAIEGYHTDRIADVYGVIDSYITVPETMNDDVVYELVFLDVFARHGRKLTARQLPSVYLRALRAESTASSLTVECSCGVFSTEGTEVHGGARRRAGGDRHQANR